MVVITVAALATQANNVQHNPSLPPTAGGLPWPLHVVKNSVLALMVTSVVACGSVGKTDERLEGVWVSDKKKTLAHIDARVVTVEHLRFLRENLGQLSYCFAENRTAAFVRDSREVQPITYVVEVSTPSYVMVNADKGKVRTLHFEEGCIRHEVPGWAYQEYFCRRLGVQNPCQ